MKSKLLAFLLFSSLLSPAQWQPVGDAGVYNSVFGMTEFDSKLYIAANNSLWTWDELKLRHIAFIRKSDYPSRLWTLTKFGDSLVVAGRFDRIDADTLLNIALYDGNSWHDMDGGIPDGEVFDLCVWNDTLYAAGNISHNLGDTAYNILKWTGDSWKTIPGFDEEVYDLTVIDGDLYAGGRFYKSSEGDTLARIARFNGTIWEPVGDGIIKGNSYTEEISVHDINIFNEEIYASGYFAGARNILKFEGFEWGQLPFFMITPAWCSHVTNDQILFGGRFDIIYVPDGTDILTEGIIAWDGTQLHAFGEGVYYPGIWEGSVRSIYEWNDRIYLGGVFESAGGKLSPGIVAWGEPFQPSSSIVDHHLEIQIPVVFPNPVPPNSPLHIKDYDIRPPYQIYDLLGRLVSENKLVSPAIPGLYFLNYKNGLVTKFIVE